jgi:hypothetical protein
MKKLLKHLGEIQISIENLECKVARVKSHNRDLAPGARLPSVTLTVIRVLSGLAQIMSRKSQDNK